MKTDAGNFSGKSGWPNCESQKREGRRGTNLVNVVREGKPFRKIAPWLRERKKKDGGTDMILQKRTGKGRDVELGAAKVPGAGGNFGGKRTAEKRVGEASVT